MRLIRIIPPTPLQHKRGRLVDLSQTRLPAFRANGKRVVGEVLVSLKLRSAIRAMVDVDGHVMQTPARELLVER